MTNEAHYRSLETMYKAAPVNAFYLPEIYVADAESEISIEVSEKLFHSARAVHGSVYFKMLDDAAFFAANSLEPDYFVLTTSFTTYLMRPVSEGRLRSVGKVVNRTKTQFIAESVVYDSAGNEIGRGNGVFVRSKMRLSDAMGYGD
jgi:uncharacterized protein (TIGR00369 family)